MSEAPDNNAERDARLTAIYRAAAQDAPPAALDAAILAAARREVGARPRPAGFSFGGSWRSSLSIAAVIVLSVSLVTLMRDEAPELTAPPRADLPSVETKAKSAVSANENAATGESGFVRDEQASKNIGLKPAQSGSASGPGLRPPEYIAPSARLKKDAGADRPQVGAIARAELNKRRDAVPDAAGMRENKLAAPVERQNKTAELDATREFAPAPAASPPKEAAKPAQSAEPATVAGVTGRIAENKARVGQVAATADRVEPASRAQSEYAPSRQSAAPPPAPIAAAPQAAPAPPFAAASKLERAADLAPEKWLERIVELRKLGRIDEAKASLAEFRKRYPDYVLPESLRDWAKP